MTCKAWNGRIVLQWLTDTINHASQSYDINFDHGIMALAATASRPACKDPGSSETAS